MECAQPAAAIERCRFNRSGVASKAQRWIKSFSFFALSISAVFVLSSCSPSPKINRIKAQDDIRETIFRYQFAQFQRTNERVYFLAIAGQDPPDDFMQRFADSKSFVKRGSEARQAAKTIVSSAGEQGIICDVGAIKWLNDKSAEIIGSYQVGKQSAAHFTFTLKWEKGKWKIAGKKFSGTSLN